LTTCPVRFLTVDAEALVGLFYVCYRLQAQPFGGLTWIRMSLPEAGGAADQPARVMAALDVIEAAANLDQQQQAIRAGRTRARGRRRGKRG